MRQNKMLKTKVIDLRLNGKSLGQIYAETNVPKTTIRSWIKDIVLSEEQLKVLRDRTQHSLQLGRIINQEKNKRIRLSKESDLLKEGISQIGRLSERELLIACIALYWSEGFKNKHERRLGFCNSDPEMIVFYLNWLRKILGVKNEDILLRLCLNQSYIEKTEEIVNYWSKITELPNQQFTKTFYQNTKWKKQFNTGDYHGVLRIHVKDSLDQLLLMKGWIQGLKAQLV